MVIAPNKAPSRRAPLVRLLLWANVGVLLGLLIGRLAGGRSLTSLVTAAMLGEGVGLALAAIAVGTGAARARRQGAAGRSGPAPWVVHASDTGDAGAYRRVAGTLLASAARVVVVVRGPAGHDRSVLPGLAEALAATPARVLVVDLGDEDVDAVGVRFSAGDGAVEQLMRRGLARADVLLIDVTPLPPAWGERLVARADGVVVAAPDLPAARRLLRAVAGRAAAGSTLCAVVIGV